MEANKLGLLPLVKSFGIRGTNTLDLLEFSSKYLHKRSTLRSFSKLTNVRELRLDFLDIPSFMPKIRDYFGHFLPTVLSLALRIPQGSRRQIIFFIGMFHRLEDLQLLYDEAYLPDEEPADDPTPDPPSVPPLRGSLTMGCLTRVGILEDIIDLFGGIRFRRMDLFYVCGMRLLLDASVNTLETLRLYPNDPWGQEGSPKVSLPPVNDIAARYSPEDFDLSRNKLLRTLEVTVQSFDEALVRTGPLTTTSSLVRGLSTMTPSITPQVIFFYRNDLGILGALPACCLLLLTN